jgi:hypothetical protein
MVLREDIPLRDALELILLYHMHGRITPQSALSSTERPKPQAWIDTAFHRAMLLFHYALSIGGDETTADDGSLYCTFTLFSVDLQGLDGLSCPC